MRAITTPWFSAASLRELGIKQALNRAAFNVQPVLLRRALLESGWQELMITAKHLACYPGPIRWMTP